MREEGLEPSRLAAQEPKSCVSASSTTLAGYMPHGITSIFSRNPVLTSIILPHFFVEGRWKSCPILIVPLDSVHHASLMAVSSNLR